MKNTEWALVAYLSQSKYGKYGNSIYTGANKEIYINNNSTCLTGCSGGVPSASPSSECTNYDVITNQENGQGALGAGASTTGNIYGIYDMSGGTDEYVMGNYNQYSGYSFSNNSGYTGTNGPDSGGRPWPESKYYDLYTTSNENAACGESACKGHALNEVAEWYSDYFGMVDGLLPWFRRGGSWDTKGGAGVFGFFGSRGYASVDYSFRLVLTP